MSKDIPEVGDVWEFKYGFDKTYIEEANLVGENKRQRIRALLQVDKRYVVQRDYYVEGFVEDHRYLGKSKANINQLFEVQDD